MEGVLIAVCCHGGGRRGSVLAVVASVWRLKLKVCHTIHHQARTIVCENHRKGQNALVAAETACPDDGLVCCDSSHTLCQIVGGSQ